MKFCKLDRFLDTMPQRGIPFCELIVTQAGSPVYRRRVGCSDAEQRKPMAEDDLYWIFSASKVITCTAAMRLVEEGKLSLDDPVSKYIPSFANLSIIDREKNLTPCPIPMTVEHLFTMTGGMSYDLNDPVILDAIANTDGSTLSLVSAMASIPLRFVPGTHYRYSLCHDVLAAVVEVVSGMRFSDYLQQLIFDPLGMKDTGFRPTEAQKSRFAAAYNYHNSNGTSTLRETENAYTLTDRYDSGGAGLFSCAEDYIKFATALACGGTSPCGYRLLKPETIAQMEVNHLCPDALKDFVSGRLYGYGWGLCGRVHINPVVSLSRASVGEFGWDGAANALAMVDRKKQVALFYGTQVRGCAYGYNYLHPVMRNLVYEGLEA